MTCGGGLVDNFAVCDVCWDVDLEFCRADINRRGLFIGGANRLPENAAAPDE